MQSVLAFFSHIFCGNWLAGIEAPRDVGFDWADMVEKGDLPGQRCEAVLFGLFLAAIQLAGMALSLLDIREIHEAAVFRDRRGKGEKGFISELYGY